MAKNKPVHVIKLGNVRATIWVNEGQPHPLTEVVRVYKEGEEWKKSNYYSLSELVLAEKATNMAHAWCQDWENAAKSSETEE